MSQEPEELSTETYYELPDETPITQQNPIERTLEALAQQQIQQSKIMEEIARRQNTPVPVTIQQMATPPATNDPIDVMQADINNRKNQLDQLRNNGDIDTNEYHAKYQELVSPLVEQVKDLKHRRELEETKTSLSKTFEDKFAEQQKLLESIQNENKIGWLTTFSQMLKYTQLEYKVIDILKMDIENGEWNFLNELDQFLSLLSL